MTVVNLESLVLRGVNVGIGVGTGLVRLGSNPTVEAGTPAMPLSPTRHPFLGYPPASYAGTRPAADTIGVAWATYRAGRPGSQAGVLYKHALAISASRVIHLGWPLHRMGDSQAATAACGETSGRLSHSRIPPLHSGKQRCLSERQGSGKPAGCSPRALRAVRG